MNKILLVLVIAAALCSCNSTPKKTANAEVNKDQKISTALSVDDLLHSADKKVNETVEVIGVVNHVCQHSGRRCFLKGADGAGLKIEASGELKGFNKEIVGMIIKVKGVLKEQRISKDEIAKITAAQKVEEEDGHCDTESNNVIKMRYWMKKNGKDYYAFYYVDGTEYEVVK
jgi:hypothetical protein